MTDQPVAIVTGAARGIGAATVDALVASGWSVVATDVCADDPVLDYALASRADLAAVAERGGSNVVAVVADVRNLPSLQQSVAQAIEHFGRLDAAIAIAGVISCGASSWNITDEVWQSQFDVNVTGVWNLARATVPSLIESAATSPVNHASFVAVSSAAGRRGFPTLGAYSASKHAVIGLVTSMAGELGTNSVTANVVCPGSTQTSILDASAAAYGMSSTDEFARQHLIPRIIEPAEVAAAISYLCSAPAAAMTGAVVPVDAGMGAR